MDHKGKGDYQAMRIESLRDPLHTTRCQGSYMTAIAEAVRLRNERPQRPVWIEHVDHPASSIYCDLFTTEFSEDRRHRYTLIRHFRELPFEQRRRYCMFIGLNPSTADELTNDATIRRCIGFAKEWNFDSLIMTNLFAYRATQPRDMKAQSDPVGVDNDLWLVRCARRAELIVAAWGRHGIFQNRDKQVVDLLVRQFDLKLQHFGTNSDGTPKHPLRLPKSLEPIPYEL